MSKIVKREKEIREEFKNIDYDELLDKAVKLQRAVDKQAEILDEWYQYSEKRKKKIKNLERKVEKLEN